LLFLLFFEGHVYGGIEDSQLAALLIFEEGAFGVLAVRLLFGDVLGLEAHQRVYVVVVVDVVEL